MMETNCLRNYKAFRGKTKFFCFLNNFFMKINKWLVKVYRVSGFGRLNNSLHFYSNLC